MNREQFIQYISDEYGVDEEYLFAKHPLFCVFRHSSNRKWFAVVMDLSLIHISVLKVTHNHAKSNYSC